MGGGVMKSADVIIPYVQEYVSNHAWTPWGKVQIRAAELGQPRRTARRNSTAYREKVMARRSNYDKFPFVPVTSNDADCATGGRQFLR